MSRTTKPKRAYVETYGCQMNISDGELMQGVLADGGYRIVDTPEDADVILVNTCAIREHAEQRVLGRVSQLNGLKRERPDMVIGVTGCMAQRMGDQLLEDAPYVDLVMGPDAYRTLPQALGRLRPDLLPADDEMAEVLGEEDVTVRRGPSENGPADALPGVLLEPDGGPTRKRGRQLAVLDLNMGENYAGLEQRRAD